MSAVVLSHWHSWTLASASLPWRHSWTSAASLRACRPAFAQAPNLRGDLGTLSWTPPGFSCHLRADAELFCQRCTQRRSSALFSERNPALVTHEVLERCSSFLPRALTFLAHPTLAANPNPALDHTRRLALQLATSSERPLHDIHIHERCCIPRLFCPQLLQHVAKLSLVFTVEQSATSAASVTLTRSGAQAAQNVLQLVLFGGL